MTGRDLKAEAEEVLAHAEATVRRQRAVLDAMKDPVVAVACQLHAIFCREWCNEGACFDPTPTASHVLDGWTISANEVRQRYMTAAQRIYVATRDLGLTPEQTGAVIRIVIDVKRLGDEARFRR